jgi:hypothetical protein
MDFVFPEQPADRDRQGSGDGEKLVVGNRALSAFDSPYREPIQMDAVRLDECGQILLRDWRREPAPRFACAICDAIAWLVGWV